MDEHFSINLKKMELNKKKLLNVCFFMNTIHKDLIMPDHVICELVLFIISTFVFRICSLLLLQFSVGERSWG